MPEYNSVLLKNRLRFITAQVDKVSERLVMSEQGFYHINSVLLIVLILATLNRVVKLIEMLLKSVSLR